MTTVTKSISYAYPTSQNALELGMGDEGCFYVEQAFWNIDGSGQCSIEIAHNCEGFSDKFDPDLIALYREYEGDICPDFKLYGDPRLLELIAA